VGWGKGAWAKGGGRLLGLVRGASAEIFLALHTDLDGKHMAAGALLHPPDPKSRGEL
jgi:hypothetical protein